MAGYSKAAPATTRPIEWSENADRLWAERDERLRHMEERIRRLEEKSWADTLA